MPRKMLPKWFSVIPTFTAGSPAQVDRETALRVAKQEAEGFERAKSGIYGEATAAAATLRETHGIAYAWVQIGRGANVVDLISGEERTFKKFEDFQAWGRGVRLATRTFHNVMYQRRPTAADLEAANRKERGAHWDLVSQEFDVVTIRDVGPWDKFPTITNDAARVAAEVNDICGLEGRRLFYYDSDNALDEILLTPEGKFRGFAPGPRVPSRR